MLGLFVKSPVIDNPSPFTLLLFRPMKAMLALSLLEGSVQPRSMNSIKRFFIASALSPLS